MKCNIFSSLPYLFVPSLRYRILSFEVGDWKTNCYFLIDRQTSHCAVIDPGNHVERLLAAIKEHGLSVDCILLTHAHADHCEALATLKDATQAPFAMHKDDLTLYTDAFPQFPKPDLLLKDENEIVIGNGSVRVLHTPGHSPGSVCYLAGKHLFSGDTLFRGSCGRCDLTGGNSNQLMQSLGTLCGLGFGIQIYPGHGAQTTLSRELEHNPILLQLLKR